MALEAELPEGTEAKDAGAGAGEKPLQPVRETTDEIPAATLCHGGRFIRYNVFGTFFELTTKYKPPIRPVGSGAYGTVCSALNSETGQHVAIKKIANAFITTTDAKRALREVKLTRHMDHENVVAILDIIPPAQRNKFDDVYISYELMDTDLHQIIRSKQALSEEHCQIILYQILCGLKYIHSANVLHRDLKPSNVLLNAKCDLKICDFGLARTVSESDFMTENVVTRWYRAPELLLTSAYTAAIDVWSMGCIFMELMNRKPLFPGTNPIQQLHLIMEDTRWYRAPELLLTSAYTAAIDFWSMGCIFMELMNRKPLFTGTNPIQQLRLIMELIGTPDYADLDFLHENAKRYIRKLPRLAKQSFTEKFPHVKPLAIDLVEKMLTFDPRQRVTVEGAVAHPYFGELHNPSDEPICSAPFSFDFEQQALSEEQMKDLIYQEALTFNPDFRL